MLMAGLRATACHVGVPDREGKEGGGGGWMGGWVVSQLLTFFQGSS